MSEENVEVIRNVFAMIDRGDAEAWDLLPPDFVIDLSRRLIDPVVLRGADEMRAFYRDLDATWADGARVEVKELIDAGDKVLVRFIFSLVFFPLALLMAYLVQDRTAPGAA